MNIAHPETILSYAARLHLAENLGIAPDDLDFLGYMSLIPGQTLALFNIMRAGSSPVFIHVVGAGGWGTELKKCGVSVRSTPYAGIA